MEPRRPKDGVDLNQLASEMDDRSTDGLLAAIRRASKARSDSEKKPDSKVSILRFNKKRNQE
jgi:hypothetical protein